jgi:nitroreductase
MEFLEVIKTRHSCRNYSCKEIDHNILQDILEAGRCAPSAQNKQPWRYLVINQSDLIKKIAFHSIIGSINFFIKDAPIVIVACADMKSSLKINQQDYYLVDVAISFQQMMLTAWNYGIGTCWLAAFDEGKLKELLDIPKNYRIVGLSPFGYPKEKNFYSKTVSLFAGSAKRKPINELFFYNSFS